MTKHITLYFAIYFNLISTNNILSYLSFNNELYLYRTPQTTSQGKGYFDKPRFYHNGTVIWTSVLETCVVCSQLIDNFRTVKKSIIQTRVWIQRDTFAFLWKNCRFPKCCYRGNIFVITLLWVANLTLLHWKAYLWNQIWSARTKWGFEHVHTYFFFIYGQNVIVVYDVASIHYR